MKTVKVRCSSFRLCQDEDDCHSPIMCIEGANAHGIYDDDEGTLTFSLEPFENATEISVRVHRTPCFFEDSIERVVTFEGHSFSGMHDSLKLILVSLGINIDENFTYYMRFNHAPRP